MTEAPARPGPKSLAKLREQSPEFARAEAAAIAAREHAEDVARRLAKAKQTGDVILDWSKPEDAT